MIPPAVDLLRARLEQDPSQEGSLYRMLDRLMQDNPLSDEWTVDAYPEGFQSDRLEQYLRLQGYRLRLQELHGGALRVIVSF